MMSASAMRLRGSLLCLCGSLIVLTPTLADTLVGFSPSGSTAEESLERRFDADLSAADLRAWMEQ